MSSEVHPLPLVLPDKAQGQRGSGLLVTSANCPDGPASPVLFNTSRSVGVEGGERAGSCHLYSFTPTGSFTPPVTEPPAPLPVGSPLHDEEPSICVLENYK